MYARFDCIAEFHSRHGRTYGEDGILQEIRQKDGMWLRERERERVHVCVWRGGGRGTKGEAITDRETEQLISAKLKQTSWHNDVHAYVHNN